MFRAIFLTILILGLIYLILGASGVVIHFENIPHYLKFDSKGGDRQEILFKNGMMMKGVILEETEDTIRLDTDGAVMTYKRSDIKSVKSDPKIWLVTDLKNNFETHHKVHPLFSHDKSKTLSAKWDHFAMEPSRIAEQIRRDNPEITGQGGMVAKAEALRDQMNLQKAKMEAEMRKANQF